MKTKLLILFAFFIILSSVVSAEDAVDVVIPSDAKIEYNKGIDYYKLGQYDEAAASFRTAIRLAPDYINAYYNLGALLDYLQQYDEALAVFEQIIARKPKDYEAVYMAVKLSANLSDRTGAARYAAMIPKSNVYYQKANQVLTKHNITPARSDGTGNPPSNVNNSSGCYPNITSPTGITSDKFGNLYVSSFTDNAILKIQPDGKKMLFYKGTNLKGPISLASDSLGNIYIANYNANNILKISNSGVCSVLSKDVSKPYGVHVNGDILFVACQGSNSVLRIKLR